MATKPNAKDYALPSSCINADENAEGGLAKYPEPLSLSLAERVLLYNQEVLFLQGREILQGLTKLNASKAGVAAVDDGFAPVADAGPAANATPAANAGSAANASPAAIDTHDVKPFAEAFASAGRAQHALAPAFKNMAAAAEDEEARKKVIEAAKELEMRAAKTSLTKDNATTLDAEDSETEDGEQATTKEEEISQALKRVARVSQLLGTNQNRNLHGPYYQGQQWRALLKLEALGVMKKSGYNHVVPKSRTATVDKTVEKDGADAERVEQKKSNKRARSSTFTSNSKVEERSASKLTDNMHQNKKVKVKVESEPGIGGF